MNRLAYSAKRSLNSVTQLPEIPTGELIDKRYKIEKVLGQGGFGRTYLVSHQGRHGETWVLKELVPSGSQDYVVQKSQELFEQEAKVLYQLEHPQIPKFLECFQENGRLFLVQSYIEGKTYWQLLNERKDNQGPFSEAEVVTLMQQVLPILDYLHQRNIIHRDISPDNIIFNKDNQKPYLIDFGVVKQAMTEVVISVASSTSGQRSMVGKIGYSPPEQIRLGQCYPNSDFYALAVTALVLLTGRTPDELFDGYSCEWKWTEFVSVSPELTEIFQKMLAEKPCDRHKNAQELLTLLEQVPQAPLPPLEPESEPEEAENDGESENTSSPQDESSGSPLGPTVVSTGNAETVQDQDSSSESDTGLTEEMESPDSPPSEKPLPGELTEEDLIADPTDSPETPRDVPGEAHLEKFPSESASPQTAPVATIISQPSGLGLKAPEQSDQTSESESSTSSQQVSPTPEPAPAPIPVTSRNANKTKMAIIAMGVLAGAFTTYAIVSAIRTPILVRQRELAEQFQQALQAGNSAMVLAGGVDSIEELQDISQRLQRAIAQLDELPEDVNFSEELQNTRDQFQQQLNDFESQIAQRQEQQRQEQERQEQLERLEETVDEARESTANADSIEQLETAKGLWEDALNQIESLDEDARPNNSSQRQEDYQAQIVDIERRVTELRNPPAPPPPQAFTPEPHYEPEPHVPSGLAPAPDYYYSPPAPAPDYYYSPPAPPPAPAPAPAPAPPPCKPTQPGALMVIP